MNEATQLARDLKKRFGCLEHRHRWSWPYPVLDVLDCVLSLNRRYDAFVVPRVESFRENNPNITTLPRLLRLIDSYSTPRAFSVTALDYNDTQRAAILRGVVVYLINLLADLPGKSERTRLRKWAVRVQPQDYVTLQVKGFGLAGFQYFRMLCGANTSKPDKHINRYVSKVVGRDVTGMEALLLLERAATIARLPLRAVDGAIWKEGARKQRAI